MDLKFRAQSLYGSGQRIFQLFLASANHLSEIIAKCITVIVSARNQAGASEVKTA